MTIGRLQINLNQLINLIGQSYLTYASFKLSTLNLTVLQRQPFSSDIVNRQSEISVSVVIIFTPINDVIKSQFSTV